MKRLLTFLLLLPQLTEAVDHVAANLTYAEVQSKVNGASSGDRVLLPAGTATDWTQPVYVEAKNIEIVGAGIDSTFIEYNIDSTLTTYNPTIHRGAVFAFNNLVNDGNPAGVHHLEISPGTTNSISASITISADSGSGAFEKWRCSNVRFNFFNERSFYTKDIFGVTWDCELNVSSGRVSHYVENDYTYGQSYGDGPWETPVQWGTANFFYYEDCTITAENVANEAAFVDGSGGSLVVIRFNTLNDAKALFHNAEANRDRSGRAAEFYYNTCFDTGGSNFVLINMRGGTWYAHHNTLTGGFNHPWVANTYRASKNEKAWSGADGLNDFDVNDLTDGAGTPGGAGDGVFESGTSTDTANELNWQDTAGITVSGVGTTVTASSNIFAGGMVGNYIKVMGAGSETFEITTFNSPTEVVVADDFEIAGTPITAERFCVQPGPTRMIDLTKVWTPDQWGGYLMRLHYSFTGTSGTATTVTVAGAGWEPDQWGRQHTRSTSQPHEWVITKVSTGERGRVYSNTSDTLNLQSTGNSYVPDFTGGGDFVLSTHAHIIGNTATELDLDIGPHSAPIVKAGVDYEIRKITQYFDMGGAGGVSSDIPPPNVDTGNNPGFTQALDPSLFLANNWTDNPRGAGTEPWMHVAGAGAGPLADGKGGVYVEDVHWLETKTSYDGSTGAGEGTLASRPASPSMTGTMYWATDVGEWNSESAGADGQLYRWNGASWDLHYKPYSYPHPLRSGTTPEPAPERGSTAGTLTTD